MSWIYKKWLVTALLLSLITTSLIMITAVWGNRQLELIPELEPLLYWLLISFLIGQNFVVTPWVYWLDKRKAQKRTKERIPELVLHTIALLGGGLGALMSQQLFRHKTQKWSFKLIAWGSLMMSFTCIYVLLNYRS